MPINIFVEIVILFFSEYCQTVIFFIHFLLNSYIFTLYSLKNPMSGSINFDLPSNSLFFCLNTLNRTKDEHRKHKVNKYSDVSVG